MIGAIKATFADWRTVKSRKMLQLIFEVPLETQAEVLTTLGAPMPDRDIWVALARLNPMTESEVMPVDRKPEGHSAIDTPPSSQTLGAGAEETVAVARLSRAAASSNGRTSDLDSDNAGSNPAAASNREEVMPAEGEPQQSAFDAPPSSQTLGAGAQGSSSATSLVVERNPVAPEGDENRGTCPTCHGEKRILHIYERPGGPPGNQWIDCPDCTGARAVKRAVMLCKDEQFRHWVAHQRWDGTPDDLASEYTAAEHIRNRCQIASRRDLAHDERARERFKALMTEYDLWRGRIPEQRG
jgi:hypothetical protein